MALLVDALRRAAESTPDKPALIVADRTITFADLDAMSSAAARHLESVGVNRGDCVALHLSNGVEIVVAYFACFKRGAIALPINTRFKSQEIDYVLRHAGAVAYIGQPDLAREILGWPDHVRVRYVEGELVRLEPDTTYRTESRDDDPAAVLYTSGTTARPKGVTHTQRTMMALAESSAALLGDPNDVGLIPLPMVHMAALLGVVSAIRAGITIVTAPQFDPNVYLDAIERHRVTAMTGMPVFYRALAEAQRHKPRDVRSMRMYAVGGDSVPTALQDQFQQFFGRPLVEVYGLSEVVPVTMNRVDDVRCGSLGQLAPGVSVRIVDGELWVKAPGVFVGYWNNPEATAQAFRDGWFLTGDLAHEAADGVFWFDGRKKEIIVRGGSNISPQEVEEAIYQHPAVAEVAVVGAPDERWGEVVVAAVVLRDGHAITESDLLAFVRERISLYKCPEQLMFVAALPKGPTGKVLRRAVKESFVQRV
ncbi:MAG TPA: AMP-binding protein [Vicinamibacterales bacterium]|nr:AMP-binding protein [Vicinamibacterales bacterium]